MTYRKGCLERESLFDFHEKGLIREMINECRSQGYILEIFLFKAA